MLVTDYAFISGAPETKCPRSADSGGDGTLSGGSRSSALTILQRLRPPCQTRSPSGSRATSLGDSGLYASFELARDDGNNTTDTRERSDGAQPAGPSSEQARRRHETITRQASGLTEA